MSASQIDVGTKIASLQQIASSGRVRPSRALHEGGSTASTTPSVGARTDGPLSWLSMLRVTTVWEGVLIAVLFLLIGGLVSVRLADYLSGHELDLSSLSIESTAFESDESDGSSASDQRSYEHYLSPDTPSELLSDEGEVVRLLVASGGRTRQHQIADETGWSKSKVSRICSQMHDDGTIEKASVGRENVIMLSDEPASDAEGLENPIA